MVMHSEGMMDKKNTALYNKEVTNISNNSPGCGFRSGSGGGGGGRISQFCPVIINTRCRGGVSYIYFSFWWLQVHYIH